LDWRSAVFMATILFLVFKQKGVLLPAGLGRLQRDSRVK